jgi:hypothetical protein
MKMMTKTMQVFVCLLATISTAAALQFGDFTYWINPDGTTVAITGYTGSGGAVTIPSTIESKSVTIIGQNAFAHFHSLTSVTIPDSVTEIRSDAFTSCIGLTSIMIPDSVTTISETAFYDCTSITTIMVDAGNVTYSSVDGVVFNKDQTTLILYPPGKAGNYVIPDGVTTIGHYAFLGCDALSSVTIPDSVTAILFGAFQGCSALTSVVIPESVTTIWWWTFAQCDSLTSVVIPDSVTVIEHAAFSHCYSLTSIVIPDSVTSFEGTVFGNCDSLTSVLIGSGVTSIGGVPFANCGSLLGVYFNGNAPSLRYDQNIFRGSDQVTVYYLPDTTGWEATYAGRPTALWYPWNPVVTPQQHDFGDVEIGTTATAIITLDTGCSNETVLSRVEVVGNPDFAVTPPESMVLPPYGSLELELAFTPSLPGYTSASLEIETDDFFVPLVEVPLGGVGVHDEPPSQVQVAVIQLFLEECVITDTITSEGSGNSANKRINALYSMLDAVGDLIMDGEYELAYTQLESLYRKVDGEPNPPDFVTGEDVDGLALRVAALLEALSRP